MILSNDLVVKLQNPEWINLSKNFLASGNPELLKTYLLSMDQYFKDEYGSNYFCVYIDKVLPDGKTNNVFAYQSQNEWGKIFKDYGFNNKCPLLRQARELIKDRKYIIMPWETVSCEDREENEVAGARREHNIGDGFGMSYTSGSFKVTIAIAPEKNEKKFMDLVSSNLIPMNAALSSIVATSRQMVMLN